MEKTKSKTEGQLKNIWVFLVAHQLEDSPWGSGRQWRQCLKKALMAYELLEKLGKGSVTFWYEKQDGSERMATGTLKKGIDPLLDSYEFKGRFAPQGEGGLKGLVISYWDLLRREWRSLRVENLLTVGL